MKLLLLFGAALISGCAADAASAGETYRIVLEHARRELQLEGTVVVHPLMGRLNRIGPDDGPPINHFNDMDRAVIAAAIRDDSSYTLCEISGSGWCPTESGDVSVVLSEIHTLGDDEDGLVVAVENRRAGTTRAGVAFHSVRLKHGWRGWRVVAFEPTVGPLVAPIIAPHDAAR